MKLDRHAQAGRRVAGIATAVLAGAAGLVVTVGGSAAPAHAVDGDVTGTVFNDVNFNGVRDGASGNVAAEPPVGGVQVTATDAGGTTVGSATTAADGTYVLNVTGAASTDVRVTFAAPAGYDDGARGGASGSTVQFVTIPGGVANLGLAQVGQFNADADPFVVVPIERTSAVLENANTVYPGLPALEGFPYNQHGREGDPGAPATPAAPTVLAEQRDIANTWGTATYGTTTAFSAAFVRNGAPLGAGGTGAIYATDVAQAVGGDPNGTLWVTIPNAGATGRSSDVFPSGYDFAFDDIALTSTYRVGLGDIDVSADQTKLYAVNLNDRQLYEVQLLPGANPGDAPVGGTVTAIPLPLGLPGATQGCPVNDVRPFGLGEHRGVLYVTLTCTGESTQDASDLRGYVYAMDETTRTFSAGPVIEVALDYDRGEAAAGGATPAAWNPWTNTLNGFRPEPILSTISFDLQGNASLSIRDRQADKSADDWAPGELLKFCVNGSGDFVEESNGSCGGQAGSQPAIGYGPGDGLFYDSTFTFDNGYGHEHTFLGSALQIPGFTNVLATSMAPETPGDTSAASDYTRGKYQTGVRTLAVGDGGITNWAALQYVVAANLPHSGSFHKAAGIGDLSALLALAPVEIGNRVWTDTDGDGFQDAGEPPVVGVTVNLYADGGTQPIATAVTDAQGNYSFSNRPGVAPDASADKWGLPITANTPYDVRVDNVADFTGTGPLAGYVPTVTKAPGPNSTAIDSNGVATVVATPGGPVTVSVDNGASTPAVGTADSTFDFGFVLKEYDLMITKSLISSAPYSPGSAVTYSLVVRNNGPAVALSGLTVTDRLPAGLTFASPAASGPAWTCAPPAPADMVTCTWNGPDLAAGDTTTAITVNATVDTGVADGAALVNFSVVRPSPQQPNPETIPVGTTNDGFENGSNVPTVDNPSNNDDSQPISVTVTPPSTTTPPTTTPDTTPTTTPDTTTPTTTPVTVLPPDTIPPEVLPPLPPVAPELPVTGGNSNGLLFAALGLVLLGGLGYLLARRPRHQA